MARHRLLTRAASRPLRWLALLGLLAIAARASAEPYGPFNRTGDEWKVVETRYFRIYFTPEGHRTTARLLEIADDTFERLNVFYGFSPPDKIGVTVVAYTAYSNGFADFSRNRITLFTTPPDFHSRSRVPWLEGVFTHELSHVLSLNTAAHFARRVPLVLGTGISRSDRAQALLRLPVYGQNDPHWFSEGVAQFDTYRLGRDGYDENRRAYQRALIEDRLMFPLDKLAFFGGEQWYNTGFSFLLFLEEKYGRGTVHRLFHAASQRYDYQFEWLFSRTLGASLSELEAEFRQQVRARYAAHLTRASAGLYDGKPIALEGQDTPYRDLTPAQRDYQRDGYAALPLRYLGGKLFYRQAEMIQYGDFDPFTRSVRNVEALTDGSAVAPHTERSFFVLKPDGQSSSLLPYVYWPAFESQNLVLVDTEGDERVLQRESRLLDLDVCPARRELAGVYNDGDGSLRLALYSLDNFGSKQVALRSPSPRFPLPAQPFDEVRSPRYGPDCRKLYFSRRVGRDHDLFALDLQSGALETVSAEPAFELYPEPTARGVYYVSSRDGVMNVYLRPLAGGAPVLITQAVTAHHHPVFTPGGLVFARLYGTGFQMHFQDHGWIAGATAPPLPTVAKPVGAPDPAPTEVDGAYDYSGFVPSNLLAPTIVPLIDVEYDTGRSYGAAFEAQGGLELFAEDQLGKHALLLRGFAGSRNSFVIDYANRMLPVSLRARAGLSQSRSLYTFESGGERFEQVTDYRWGFLYGAVSLPLSLFHTLSAVAETTRDIGTTTGARTRPFDFADPRYGRELFGLRFDHFGLDRNQPIFRERDINRRGYRELDLAVFYGIDRVHPLLGQFDPTLRTGATPYLRAELHHSEYIALPALMGGFFDHSLQVDLQLGYISRDIVFLPFIGGGQLYSLSAPEYNTSVGFTGYPFYSIRGETLASLALTYRVPIARNLSLALGPLFLEDIYAQVFTSWGNIWGFDNDGHRQIPFVDRAPNGRYVLGDVGVDLRLGHFLQEIETNVGTTLRAVYRLVPFARCPDEPPSEHCLDIEGTRGFQLYAIIGGGF